MSDDRHLLTDIRVALRHNELRPVYVVDTDRRRASTPRGEAIVTDIGAATGRNNLAQAIILRLLTPRGELAALGHPQYGSRLHEMIGARNTETNRNLVRLFILESLQAEPRIAKIVQVVVEPVPDVRDLVTVLLEVIPRGQSAPLNVGPFILELEP